MKKKKVNEIKVMINDAICLHDRNLLRQVIGIEKNLSCLSKIAETHESSLRNSDASKLRVEMAEFTRWYKKMVEWCIDIEKQVEGVNNRLNVIDKKLVKRRKKAELKVVGNRVAA